MADELLMRKDVPKELTWDLSLIYQSEEEMYADLEKMQELTEKVVREYQGKINTAEAICECIDYKRQIIELIVLTDTYCELAVSVDYYNTANQERYNRVRAKETQIQAKLSFIESEIMEQDEAVIRRAIDLSNGGKCYLENLLREKPHRLHPEAERVIAALGETIEGVPYEIYNQAKLADMRFENFTAGNKEYAMGYSLFEDDYEYEKDTAVRRAAFAAFSKKLKEYENVTATAYNAQVRKEKSMADLRGFDSVFDYLLFPQKVERELYDRQIDIIMEKLAPHMRKLARLKKKIYRLDQMTYADLKLPIDAEYAPKVSIEDGWRDVEKALAIMGEDYVKLIRQAKEERWVDFAQNQGKSTGGFCASPYGRNSFILLSWNQKMSDVFTLVHELGHAGHFGICNQTQSVFDTDVSLYMVEAPSTMNELIFGNYLLKNSTDKRFQRWVLANMVCNTYYHNFVTHLLEAAYQREVYRIVDKGGSVQAEVLNKIMKDVLTSFWGEDVELTDGAELTWMRQPHYYMGLYSYTYSAGLTVATQVSKRIQQGDEQAVADWKKVLEAGSTLTPMELAGVAGIDISTDAPLLDTIETIGSMIDEICRLTEEIEREGLAD